MNSTTINLEDLLTQDEMKEVAIDCLKEHLTKSDNIERLLSNAAYQLLSASAAVAVSKLPVAERVTDLFNDATLFTFTHDNLNWKKTLAKVASDPEVVESIKRRTLALIQNEGGVGWDPDTIGDMIIEALLRRVE